MGNNAVLTRLSELARETFLLWDQSWVDFSWRHYYYEHTQRVRALALEIGRHEAADLDKLQYAALLHDITKRYDGKILRDSQGRRITNEYGFWRNEFLGNSKSVDNQESYGVDGRIVAQLGDNTSLDV
ncbi:HD domain-containing protein, partial [Candidatus Bathyarchaeota archaeon]|nr:HD domain-containing protein [Candidatus Bathyarchaeota archaeon]